MMNHATIEVFFDELRVPAENLIGQEGKSFRYILSGMNAERILIASECVGDAKWFIDKASAYATERHVFGRAIGQNQGIQFPISRAYLPAQYVRIRRFAGPFLASFTFEANRQNAHFIDVVVQMAAVWKNGLGSIEQALGPQGVAAGGQRPSAIKESILKRKPRMR